MNCDTCERRMNYTFFINDEHWRKVVGEERFSKNVGRLCAHCTLEALGGLDWYIIWNEPLSNSQAAQRAADKSAALESSLPERGAGKLVRRIPQYDEFDNYSPEGEDIDPRFAAGWNAALAALEAERDK